MLSHCWASRCVWTWDFTPTQPTLHRPHWYINILQLLAQYNSLLGAVQLEKKSKVDIDHDHAVILIAILVASRKHRFPSVLPHIVTVIEIPLTSVSVHACGCQRGVHSGSIGSWESVGFLIVSYLMYVWHKIKLLFNQDARRSKCWAIVYCTCTHE